MGRRRPGDGGLGQLVLRRPASRYCLPWGSFRGRSFGWVYLVPGVASDGDKGIRLLGFGNGFGLWDLIYEVGACVMGAVRRMALGLSHQVKVKLIRLSGKKCMGCGYHFAKNLHPQLLARQKGAFELDHKIPLERCGTDELANLQVLCLPCHDGKTNENGRDGNPRNMTDHEWRSAGCPQDWGRKSRLKFRRGRGNLGSG